NCSVCHGSSATGSFGFPNLTDSEWLYGGTAEAIETTILSGRRGQMPPWGPILGDEKVKQVTAHVVNLSGGTADPKLAEAGKALFASTCTACHGMDGKGNQLIGAPDLTNAIWLYGGAPGQIEHSIAAGRAGQMPTFEQTLGAQKVRIVAAYVYSLSQPKK
ncbi:MAG TPA: cytochrome-c oxidase, cbb3-type subunit III, partial [Pseudomonadales bacterium]|nr:cytochrome-c oxidase, cbb3-type subunit III [Pseudomonadales bacterium]